MNCLGMLEYKSVSAGIKSCDTVLKAANVKLLYSMPVCAGKYIIIVRGDTGAVYAAIDAGKQVSVFNLVDSIIIPNLHKDIFPALTASGNVGKIEALGSVESYSIAATIIAADIALKTADIRMIEIRIAKGLGGKSYFNFTGEVGAVRESEKTCIKYLEDNGWLVYSCVIPNPHPSLAEKLY
ncbi:MAG: BMC domain-containing protein [Candidatus Muirbacterium halophilum]|nr:BMC domain-containing protein [Candidatus Muirbacterium halophilum]MCK9475290.1 BMC domain-containing protein [Candidatus Muirbacterium halophilum]